MAAVLGNAVRLPVAYCIAEKEAADASLDLGLAVYSYLVWDHSFPLAALDSLSSDSVLACSVMMAQNGCNLPWIHGYLKAYSWNCLSY